LTDEVRRFAPATERNRDPILAVLRRVLPAQGTVLEVASGTGEHCAYFATHLPALRFQPSDPDAPSRVSIAAWTKELANVAAPIELDASSATWPINAADAVMCINMIHISPWSATLGLLRGASMLLAEGGALFLYGPYRRGGEHTAPSNVAFDVSLRARNPEWGVRDLDDVVNAASEAGLHLDEVIEMPANNLSVILRRGAR
jgi:Protein of unknown function (DUF938)